MEEEQEEKAEVEKSNLKEKLKKNPWIVSTFIVGLVAVLLIVGIFNPTLTGRAVSEGRINEKIVDFVNSQGGEIEIISVEREGLLYKVMVDTGQGPLAAYVTLDGKYLLSQPIPLDVNQNQPTQTQEVEDWSVFENSLSEDLKQIILSFPDSETSQTSNQRIIEFEDYKACENSLIVFYNSGCGWCGKYYPILVEAKQDYPEFEIYALDMSENGDIANKYGARGTPANIINCKYFASGYMDKEVLYDILDQYK